MRKCFLIFLDEFRYVFFFSDPEWAEKQKNVKSGWMWAGNHYLIFVSHSNHSTFILASLQMSVREAPESCRSMWNINMAFFDSTEISRVLCTFNSTQQKHQLTLLWVITANDRKHFVRVDFLCKSFWLSAACRRLAPSPSSFLSLVDDIVQF